MLALNVLIFINGVSGIVALWWATNDVPIQSVPGLLIGGLLCMATAVWLELYVKPRVRGDKE